MQRDLLGYGKEGPKVVWPKAARVAVNFVLNYEEGAESNVMDGDSHSENYLHDLPGSVALEGERHLSVESLFEYGSRTGVWRLLRLFKEYRLPLTIFAVGLALERNPLLAKELRDSPHEIAGHGYRWINYRQFSPVVEKRHIHKTIDIIEQMTGKQVSGWYTGRKSPHTRQLVVEAGLKYDSDSYADDLPFWETVHGKNHLVIPYTLDVNDLRYTTSPGWNSGTDFFNYLKATFDCLYNEGATHPKVMTIGLHARISGHPGRCEALRQFLDYIKPYQDIWVCRREEIAEHWLFNHLR
jgi:putative urate catabolism protein